jgi:hypothetical protein
MDTRVSNWTLATGTCPGQRQVSSPPSLKAVAVSDDALRPELLDALVDESDVAVLDTFV